MCSRTVFSYYFIANIAHNLIKDKHIFFFISLDLSLDLGTISNIYWDDLTNLADLFWLKRS